MSDTFVPFFSHIPDKRSDSSNSGKDAFVPTGSGVAAHSDCAHSESQNGPVVTVQREGDRVRSIRIECACGQVIELDCQY